jgi:hypothetical protein
MGSNEYSSAHFQQISIAKSRDSPNVFIFKDVNLIGKE